MEGKIFTLDDVGTYGRRGTAYHYGMLIPGLYDSSYKLYFVKL